MYLVYLAKLCANVMCILHKLEKDKKKKNNNKINNYNNSYLIIYSLVISYYIRLYIYITCIIIYLKKTKQNNFFKLQDSFK